MVIIVEYLQRKEENKCCTCNHGKWGIFSFLNLSFVHVKEDISSFIFASFLCLWLTSVSNAASGKTALWNSTKCYSLLDLSWSGIKATLYSIKIYISSCYKVCSVVKFEGTGMAQWWERSPPTNVGRVRFRPGAICGLSLLLFSPCSEGFSPGSPVFLPPQKLTSPYSDSIRIEDLPENQPRLM